MGKSQTKRISLCSESGWELSCCSKLFFNKASKDHCLLVNAYKTKPTCKNRSRPRTRNYNLWTGNFVRATSCIVSASDVTPTDRWLNIWCIWHTYLETLQECWSHHRIGWIIQDFRETRVSRSLTFRLETKMLWRQTPQEKKKAVVFTNVTTNAYQGQLNAGFSKVCEIFKVRGIESLKYVQEFYTPVCYRCDISTPRNVTLNETNYDWLFDM